AAHRRRGMPPGSRAEAVRSPEKVLRGQTGAPRRLDVEGEAVTASTSRQTHRLLLEDSVDRAPGETERRADPLAGDALDPRRAGDLHRARVSLQPLRGP